MAIGAPVGCPSDHQEQGRRWCRSSPPRRRSRRADPGPRFGRGASARCRAGLLRRNRPECQLIAAPRQQRQSPGSTARRDGAGFLWTHLRSLDLGARCRIGMAFGPCRSGRVPKPCCVLEQRVTRGVTGAERVRPSWPPKAVPFDSQSAVQNVSFRPRSQIFKALRRPRDRNPGPAPKQVVDLVYLGGRELCQCISATATQPTKAEQLIRGRDRRPRLHHEGPSQPDHVTASSTDDHRPVTARHRKSAVGDRTAYWLVSHTWRTLPGPPTMSAAPPGWPRTGGCSRARVRRVRWPASG